jgi:hypothetical protein
MREIERQTDRENERVRVTEEEGSKRDKEGEILRSRKLKYN